MGLQMQPKSPRSTAFRGDALRQGADDLSPTTCGCCARAFWRARRRRCRRFPSRARPRWNRRVTRCRKPFRPSIELGTAGRTGRGRDEPRPGHAKPRRGRHARGSSTRFRRISARSEPSTVLQYPHEFVILQNNLATAFLSMPMTDERAKDARSPCRASVRGGLKVVDLIDHPTEYAMLQNNLGNALQYVSSSHTLENNLRAIEAYDEALKVRTRETDAARIRQHDRQQGQLSVELAG